MTRQLGFLEVVEGGIRNFENSKNRHFEDSRIRRLVELFACGLFKIGVLLYLGGVICKKSSLFSQGGEKRALDVFSLDSVGRRGGVIRVR